MAANKLESEKRFILELRLDTTPMDEQVLNKRLEIARRIYNQCVSKTKKRYEQIIITKKWRESGEKLKEFYSEREQIKKETGKTPKRSKEEKEILDYRNDVLKENGFTEFGLMDIARIQAKPFKAHIDAVTADKIGKRLWTAWNKVIYGNGKQIHFCKYGEFNSVEGKTNKSGIRIRTDYTIKKRHGKTFDYVMTWKGVEVPVIYDRNNSFEREALEKDIAYTRILRRKLGNKDRFYVQIVLKDSIPAHRDKSGNIKRQLGNGTCKVDVGLTKVTVMQPQKKEILLDDISNREYSQKKETELLQKMDSSRRIMNPDNYNPDGTIKKNGSRKMTWVYSNRYKTYRNQLRELRRHSAAVRKDRQIQIANEIIKLGDQFEISALDYTKYKENNLNVKNDDGEYKNIKTAKYVQNNAPSQFTEILKRKIHTYDGKIIE